MSYFCANSISLDREAKTFKVKGGDNNVVPRSNSWNSNPIPIKCLLSEIHGGMIQFTTRSDKHLAIEAAVTKANKALEALTGCNAYQLSAIIENREGYNSLRRGYSSAITRWMQDPGHMSADYVAGQIKELKALCDILENGDTLWDLTQIVNSFVDEICNPPKDGKQYLIKCATGYFSKVNRRSARVTSYKEYAGKFTELKAREIAGRYNNVELVEA